MNQLKFRLSKLVSTVYKASGKNLRAHNNHRILTYHSVGDVEQNLFNNIYKIDKNLFKDHMMIVKKLFNKNIKDLERIKLAEPVLQPVLNITFDDGYKDNLSIVAPIMNALNLHFTVFVITDFLKKEHKNYLNNEDLKELSALPNVSIGSHSKSHSNLTRLNKNEIISELKGSKSCIEDIIGKKVTMFSYPHGGVNKTVRDLVKSCGFKIAANSHFDTNKIIRDEFMLKRNEIWSVDSIKIFTDKLGGNWDWLKYRNSFNQ